MHIKRIFLLAVSALCLSACLDELPPPATAVAADPALVQLGRELFNDASLSSTGAQSCASCHTPARAFTDPDNTLPVSEGAVTGRFGTRNGPSALYTAFVPALHPEDDDGDVLWVGGLFIDGRVDTLEAQAEMPFLNANEMNNASVDELIGRLRASSTRTQYEIVFGANSLDDDTGSSADELLALQRLTAAIAAFERETEFAPFSSKFDAVLAGRASFTALETDGMAAFVRADKGNCAACHVLSRGANGEPPLFTDFTYDNLGVPRHPDRSLFAADFVDPGLETTLLARGIPATEAAPLRGKFRVPSLRNVARTAPYMHNGVFTDLRTVIEFYATRDTDPARWAAIGDTEVPATVNHSELGNLALDAHDIDALVAFMRTLDDGFFTP